MNIFRQTVATLLLAMLASPLSFAQEAPVPGWHHKDPSEGIYGVGSEKAHELLKGRTPAKVIVAILDSGVDTDHEDLKDNIWVNTDEIPGNGIDDDKNGYVDDVNGWNFLGNAQGVNLDAANLEMTRIYRKLAPRFEGVESKKAVAKTDLKDYELFKQVETEILKELNETAPEYEQINAFKVIYTMADSAATADLGEGYTLEKVQGWEGEDIQLSKQILSGVMQDPNFTKDAIDKYHSYLKDKLAYHYNPQYVDRSFIGDDYEKTDERFYGNPDVSAPHDDHGTHVAGIVGSVSGNGLGIDGICKSCELMILRTVPNGDEFDKDVANSIRYAADNGAHIINMSFGKGYSPQMEAVHQAIRYAEEKGVLMVHAAGNDAADLDKAANFPHPYYTFQKEPCSTWLTVGASSSSGDASLVGPFSNYGKKRVDLFAPGVQVYSAKPNDTYEFEDGTSMAAPVVSGVAALIKSYFPDITAQELKQLLLETSNKYPKLTVLKPDPEQDGTKTTKFGKLSSNGGVVNAYNAALKATEMFP